jgi:rhodanese-related sulfurtransferase
MKRLACPLACLLLLSCQSTNRDVSEPDGVTDTAGDESTDVASDESTDVAPDESTDSLPGDVGGEEPIDLPAWPGGDEITCEEVHERLVAGDPDMLLLNVVDEEYYSLGIIEGSLVIPWDLLEGRLAEVDPSRYVVLYCRRGIRSNEGYTTLTGAGYEHVWIMTGGIEEWTSLGYPVVDYP